MTWADFSPLANHIWQSTVCVAVAWVLALALRRNRAAVRYGVWLAASVKFLVPFAWLAAIGARFEWRAAAPAIAQVRIPDVIAQIGQPFAPASIVVPLAPAAAVSHLWLELLLGVWVCGILVGLVFWARSVRRMRAILRNAKPLDLHLPIPVVTAPGRLEPGVFGIWKPVLLLPEGIAERLTPEQLEAVLAHELRHVHRRDNLTAAIHMLVETVFWFHPAVWWIRTHLVEEREHACDEGALRLGSEPHVYAESILKVCEFYLSAPVCAAGVTGGELKKRIEGIVENRFGLKLGLGKRALLAAAAALAVASPIAVGLFAQTPTPKLEFEVASVRANLSGDQEGQFDAQHGNVTAENFDLKELIVYAYHVPERMISGPGWLDSARFDINAKGNGDAPDSQVRLMLQSLLEDRLRLKVHRETKEGSVYFLTVMSGGLKAQRADTPNPAPYPQVPPGPHVLMQNSHATMADLAQTLTNAARRTVIDRTGVQGAYRVRAWWGSNPDSDAPDLFTALQEQLGLKLESGRGPIETLVIDQADKIPTEN
jgi:uncharacterized protein (TIGR03435 family)